MFCDRSATREAIRPLPSFSHPTTFTVGLGRFRVSTLLPPSLSLSRRLSLKHTTFTVSCPSLADAHTSKLRSGHPGLSSSTDGSTNPIVTLLINTQSTSLDGSRSSIGTTTSSSSLHWIRKNAALCGSLLYSSQYCLLIVSHYHPLLAQRYSVAAKTKCCRLVACYGYGISGYGWNC